MPRSGARATRAADLLAPVVIHYHGWTGHKGSIDTPDQSLVQLASAGFLVVAHDCHEHGERRTDAWFRAQFNGWAFVCETMDRTRREAPALFDAVPLQLLPDRRVVPALYHSSSTLEFGAWNRCPARCCVPR